MLKGIGRSPSTCDALEALARMHYNGVWRRESFCVAETHSILLHTTVLLAFVEFELAESGDWT